MKEELNELTYNNTNITFTNNVNNIKTSDELTASALYQDKMGTAYSKGKAVVRAFNFVGISLILTAAAIKTGSLISNVYVLNPPSVSEVAYSLKDHAFSCDFTVSNSEKYEMIYYLYINNIEVLKETCSEPTTYHATYEGLNIGDKGHFYIEFSNRVDYKKTIESYTFTVEE